MWQMYNKLFQFSMVPGKLILSLRPLAKIITELGHSLKVNLFYELQILLCFLFCFRKIIAKASRSRRTAAVPHLYLRCIEH